jgi:hypothetical protein
VCFEPERDCIDVSKRSICRLTAACRDCKLVYAIAITGNLLKLIEVHSHDVFTSGNVGRIRGSLDDRRDDDGVAISCPGFCGDYELVTDRDPGVIGEPFIDCNRAERLSLKQSEREQQLDHHS